MFPQKHEWNLSKEPPPSLRKSLGVREHEIIVIVDQRRKNTRRW